MRGRGAPRRPVGQFAGNPPDPTNPTAAIVRDLQDALTGDPGLRLASSRGKRVFRAGGLVVQAFPHANGGVASEAALEALPLKAAGSRSRALGQFRGTPAMSWPDPDTGAAA
jgi:hypothetical protein